METRKKKNKTEQEETSTEKKASGQAGESSALVQLILSVPEKKAEWISVLMLALICTLPITAPLFYTGKKGDPMWFYLDASDWSQMLLLCAVPLLLIGMFVLLRDAAVCRQQRTKGSEILKQAFLPICLGLLLFWSVLSACQSDNLEQSFSGDWYRQEGVLTYCIYAVCFLAATLIADERWGRRLMNVFCGVATLVSLISLFDYEPVNEWLHAAADTATFFNQNHYGYYIAMTTVISCTLFVSSPGKNRIWDLLRLIQVGLLTNAMVHCIALGTLLAVSIALPAYGLLIWWKEPERRKRMLLTAAEYLLILLWINNGDWKLGQDLGVFGEDLMRLVTGENVESVGSSRGVLWMRGMQMIGECPLFGYGPDNLGTQYARFDVKMDRAHNEFIQMAASLGIPALLFYVAGLCAHLKHFIQVYPKLTSWQIGIFAGIGAYLLGSFVGNSMFYTTPYFFMLLGMSYGTLKNCK